MSVTRIGYDDPITEDDHVRWSGWMEADGQRHSVQVTFTCPDPAEFVPTVRPFLLAFLVPAMIAGHPIHLTDPVDSGTAAELAEWQEAMASLHPELRAVSITAPSRVEIPPPSWAGGITAFSGGVDSCFTALRGHRGARPGPHRRTDLIAGLMIHGFDIDASDTGTFGSAFARSRRILESFGMDAYALHTDVKRLEAATGCDWAHQVHGIWLAFALSCLEQWFARTVIPSSYPYDQPVPRWGSTAQTDPLLGSASRPLWHDGAAFDKLDKVTALVNSPAIVRDLRVCWQGERLDRNCGRCFKCVTTQACFWIEGVDKPAAFDVPATMDDVATVEFNDAYKVRLGRKMANRAGERGQTELVDALVIALAAVGEERRP